MEEEQKGQSSGSAGSNVASTEGTSTSSAQPQQQSHQQSHSQPQRLFVGWVPKTFSEQELLDIFAQFGVVRDAIILRDKLTGESRGCAFVSYSQRQEADAAIAAMDRKVHLPGALCPLEVRYARTHKYVQAGAGPEDNRQLFFARASPAAMEADIYQLFSAHGEVVEVNLFRERRSGLSKACGFVVMASRGGAQAAMNALDERLVMPGAPGPLSVKWADPELQLKKRQALEDEVGGDRKLFFAKVLRTATEEEVAALFSRYGQVREVNLFRAFQGAPTSKGCGLVTFSNPNEAAAAIAGLDSKHIWPGVDGPLVVKWMDTALQRKRREEHLAAMRQGLVPSMSMTPEAWLQLRTAQAVATASTPPASRHGGSGSLYGPDSSDNRPAGCAPDAYKLFVGNVPKAVTEQQLRPLFESLGQVVELVVVRDKGSHESKGSAFVWYATKAQADAAVAALHLRHILPDPAKEVERPLVVRRANTRKPAAPGWQQQQLGGSGMVHLSSGSNSGSLHMSPLPLGPRGVLLPGGGGYGGMAPTQGDTLIPMGITGQWHGMELGLGAMGQAGAAALLGDGSNMPPSVPDMGLNNGAYAVIDTSQFPELSLSTFTAPGYSGSTYAGGHPSGHHSQLGHSTELLLRSGDGYSGMGHASGTWLGASPVTSGAQQPAMGNLPPPPGVAAAGLMAGMPVSAGGGGHHHSSGSNVLDPSGSSLAHSSYPLVCDLGAPGQPQPPAHHSGRCALSLSLSAAELQAVSVHLAGLQTLSGVELSSTGMGPGMFAVTLKGSRAQLSTARELLSGVLPAGMLAAAAVVPAPN